MFTIDRADREEAVRELARISKGPQTATWIR
jgi:hypothetical protein